jgi:hypothetical protein
VEVARRSRKSPPQGCSTRASSSPLSTSTRVLLAALVDGMHAGAGVPVIPLTRRSGCLGLGASLGANFPPLVPQDLQIRPQDAVFSQVAAGATACSRFRFQPVRVRLPSAPPLLTCTGAPLKIT